MIARKVILFILFAFLWAYAQEESDAVFVANGWNDSGKDEIVDNFIGPENAKNEGASLEESKAEEFVDHFIVAETVKNGRLSFSAEKIHWGGRVRLAAAITTPRLLVGAKTETGFAFNYFFYKQLAVQTGLDFHAKVLRDLRKNRVVGDYYVEDHSWYESGYGYGYGYGYAYGSRSIKNYTITYMGFAVPVALRLGNKFWGEIGVQLEYAKGWTDYSISSEPKELKFDDPFTSETTLHSNGFTGFGINVPMGMWNFELGLQASVDFHVIRHPESNQHLKSIGVIFAFWR